MTGKKKQFVKNDSPLQTRLVSNSRPRNHESRSLTNRPFEHLRIRVISKEVFLGFTEFEPSEKTIFVNDLFGEKIKLMR